MELKTTVYILENLHCAHCAKNIEEKIKEIKEIEDAVVVFETKQLRVTAEDPENYIDKIKDICKSIDSDIIIISKDKNWINEKEFNSKDKKNNNLLIIIIGFILFLLSLLFSNNYIKLFISIIAYLILGAKVLTKSIKNIANGQLFDENFLMSIATIGAFCIQEYPEAVGVMLFYRIGKYFEEKAVEKSRKQIIETIDMRPETINLIIGDKISTISPENVKRGDKILIKPGDRIPLDGKILSGSSSVDVSPITGESIPVFKKEGDDVISGCINLTGQLEVLVENALSNSMVTRILSSVENAVANKPQIDRFITKFAKIYTPIIILLSLIILIVPSILFGNFKYWLYTSLTFLVMSCPCALVLSVPLAFFSGIGLGSKYGILFKGGESIEALKDIKAIVMDKTGTITEGKFKIKKIITNSKFSEDDLLRICASCEQNSNHPIAHSILNEAKKRNLKLNTPAMLNEEAGYGISAFLPEGKVLCGNAELLKKYNIEIDIKDTDFYGTKIFISIDNEYSGCFIVSDSVKENAPAIINKIKDKKLKTIILTGDTKESGEYVANFIGVDEVYSKLLPQDKLTVLNKIKQNYGKTMFIGDGINDAPVLAGSDVSAAMGAGADAAIEIADIVFMNNDLNSITNALDISEKTNKIAMQNIQFALFMKAMVIVLGIMGYANMWMAVFADTGVAMLCILNSIKLLYKKY